MERRPRRLSSNYNIIDSVCRANNGSGYFVIAVTDPETRHRHRYSAVDIENGLLIFNHYKTKSGNRKTQTYKLSPITLQLMKEYIKDKNKDLLYEFKDNTFTKLIKQIMTKPIRELRHIAMTEARRKMTDEEYVKYCNGLNSSATVGLLVYNEGSPHPEIEP